MGDRQHDISESMTWPTRDGRSPRRGATYALLRRLAWGSLALVTAAAIAAEPSVSAGFDHSAAIDVDSRLLLWGSNASGQLGLNRGLASGTPTQVNLPGRVVRLAAKDHNLALMDNGDMWSWGRNDAGQLGNGSRSASSTPSLVGQGFVDIAATNLRSAGVKADGSLWEWGEAAGNLPRRIGSGFTAVSGGWNHLLGLKGDGSLWAWGYNDFGQLGVETPCLYCSNEPLLVGTGYAAIAAGYYHNLAIKTDGSLWTWGSNQAGQLGDGSTATATAPKLIGAGYAAVAAGSMRSMAIKRDGSTWAWGSVASGVASVPQPVAGSYRRISAGQDHSLLLDIDGVVWGFGSNAYGQLGSQPGGALAVITRGFDALSAGRFHSLGLKSDGTVWAWGRNGDGQLGNGIQTRFTAPVEKGRGYSRAVAGYQQTYALREDRTLWTFGNGDAAGRQIGTDVAQLAAGAFHLLVVKTDGSLWSAFNNINGELGNGTTISTTQLGSIGTGYRMVAAGWMHSLGLKSDGTLWAWGRNDVGQLGVSTTDICLTVPVVVPCSRVPAKVGDRYVAVAAAMGKSIALKDDGSAWAWGDGVAAPRPIGEGLVQVAATASGYWGLTSNGELKALAAAARSAAVASNVRAVAGGHGQHLLVLMNDGTLRFIGKNESGQGGSGAFADAASPIAVIDETVTGYLNLLGRQAVVPDSEQLPFFLAANRLGLSLDITLTDLRATGFDGSIYFSAVVPSDSPLAPRPASGGSAGRRRAASANVTAIPVSLGRTGFKQTGPSVAADPAASGPGTLTSGNRFSVYQGLTGDPLEGGNVIVCAGVTVPALSAKGQVLVRSLASGRETDGVTQCPPIQTEATLRLYRGEASGPLERKTVFAAITPQAEDRGQARSIFSWAVTPDGRQFMQVGDGVWEPMREPMQAVRQLSVPAEGDIVVPIVRDMNLSTLVGTHVFVGMGTSWADVRNLNKAGHCYTVQ